MKIISFHREVELLEDLIGDTVMLIRHTAVVSAIKKLINAHDLLELTLHIERSYQQYNHQPPWTTSTSRELDVIRSYLVAHHADAFKPTILLPRYYRKVGSLLETMSLRM